MKKYLMIACGLFIMMSSYAEEKSLIIKLADGSETSAKLSEINKITFSADKAMVVDLKEADTFPESSSILNPIALGDVQKVIFGVVASSGIENPTAALESMSLYPNPATEYVVLSNLKGDEDVSIYRADGMLVKQIHNTENSLTIRLDGLDGGMYLIRTNNNIGKFIKL